MGGWIRYLLHTWPFRFTAQHSRHIMNIDYFLETSHLTETGVNHLSLEHEALYQATSESEPHVPGAEDTAPCH
jgi:hypothetical protein